jgi:hypothetical protein
LRGLETDKAPLSSFLHLFLKKVVMVTLSWNIITWKKKTPWPYSASEIHVYRPSDRRLSVKLVSTFTDKGCHVVSAADPHGLILEFLNRRCDYFFQAAPQFYSRGWVDHVPDQLLGKSLVVSGI